MLLTNQFKSTIIVLLALLSLAFSREESNSKIAERAEHYKISREYLAIADNLYMELKLREAGLEADPFIKAYKGYLYFRNKGLVTNPHILSIVDYSQSSSNKRLYIIDLKRKRLLLRSFVSHGKNSGNEMATSFSNANNSNKSVLGFLITAGTYSGSNGYSLRFKGMEKGINDLVAARAIVLHGSKFIDERSISRGAQAVNSLGCPAVPIAQARSIINYVRGGSVFFIYHPDEYYAAKSPVLNTRLELSLVLPEMQFSQLRDSLLLNSILPPAE